MKNVVTGRMAEMERIGVTYIATIRERRRKGQSEGDFVAATLFDDLSPAQKWASYKINQVRAPEARDGEDTAWTDYNAALKRAYASLRPNLNGFRGD